MTHFDAQNGWIQFAFANEEDMYVLPSTISVNYQRYLFYCLKKAGYEAVYFWSEGEKNPELVYMDEASGRYYEKVRPQGFFEKYFSSTDPEKVLVRGQMSTVKIQNEAVMDQLLAQLLRGRKKTAVIVSVGVFDRFFSKNDRAKKLIETYRTQKNNKNLLLITATARAEDSNCYFTNTDGILYKLFEEIRQAVSYNPHSNLYENIQRNMGDKCLYLNALNREIIRNIVRRRMMMDIREDMPMSGAFVEKVTLVIEWFYHSEKFRKETPMHFPENKKREQKVIDKGLQNLRAWGMIDAWLDSLKDCETPDQLKQYLNQNYPKDSQRCFIYTDNFLLRLWEQIIIPEELLNMYQKSWIRRKKELTEHLRAIVVRGDEALDKMCLDICMEHMKKGISHRDTNSIRYGMNGVEFLLDNSYEHEEAYDDIWKFYQKLFEISNEVYKLNLEIESNQSRIENLKIKFYELDQEYTRVKETPGITEEEQNVVLERILQCDEEMTLLDNVKLLKDNQKNQYQNVIESIENAIQSARSGVMINIQQVYAQAMDMQKKMLDQNIQTIKDVVKIKEKQPEFVESVPMRSQHTMEELEDRYRILEAKMKQLG